MTYTYIPKIFAVSPRWGNLSWTRTSHACGCDVWCDDARTQELRFLVQTRITSSNKCRN